MVVVGPTHLTSSPTEASLPTRAIRGVRIASRERPSGDRAVEAGVLLQAGQRHRRRSASRRAVRHGGAKADVGVGVSRGYDAVFVAARSRWRADTHRRRCGIGDEREGRIRHRRPSFGRRPCVLPGLGRDVAGTTAGIPATFFGDNVDPDVNIALEAACAWLADLEVRLREVRLRLADEAMTSAFGIPR